VETFACIYSDRIIEIYKTNGKTVDQILYKNVQIDQQAKLREGYIQFIGY
jgi:hypothetical protein